MTISTEALTALLQATQQNNAPGGADIFSALDTDESGTLSQEEFVSGRPGFASEADATAEFARLDANEDGSLTAQEVSEGNSGIAAQAAGPGGRPPPPPPPSGGTSSLDEIYDALDTNEDGVVDVSELVAALVEEETETSESQTQASALAPLIEQATRAYTNTSVNIVDLADSTIV